jgi:hypothetical protein
MAAADCATGASGDGLRDPLSGQEYARRASAPDADRDAMAGDAIESAGRASDGDPLARSLPAGRSRGHAYVLAVAALGLVALAALRWLATPDPRGYGTHEQLGLPPCMLIEVTRFPCPGCGVTTSVSLAAHGRFTEAFLNQPFGLAVALAIPLFALWAAWMHVSGRDLYRTLVGMRTARWLVPIVALLLASWIYKIAVTL